MGDADGVGWSTAEGSEGFNQFSPGWEAWKRALSDEAIATILGYRRGNPNLDNRREVYQCTFLVTGETLRGGVLDSIGRMLADTFKGDPRIYRLHISVSEVESKGNPYEPDSAPESGQ